MVAKPFLLLGLVALPLVAEAQRIPQQRRPAPARPTELPPQAPAIAREMKYVRLPVSFESYPMVSYFSVPGMPRASSWTSAGMGQRIDLRMAPTVSATLDVTSSFFGGPSQTHTAELGLRFRPPMGEKRLYPFADVRAGYVVLNENFGSLGYYIDQYGAELPMGAGAFHARGPGLAAGAGLEYPVSRMFSIITSTMYVRANLRTNDFSRQQFIPEKLEMNAVRYMLGVRFNPVRMVTGD